MSEASAEKKMKPWSLEVVDFEAFPLGLHTPHDVRKMLDEICALIGRPQGWLYVVRKAYATGQPGLEIHTNHFMEGYHGFFGDYHPCAPLGAYRFPDEWEGWDLMERHVRATLDGVKLAVAVAKSQTFEAIVAHHIVEESAVAFDLCKSRARDLYHALIEAGHPAQIINGRYLPATPPEDWDPRWRTLSQPHFIHYWVQSGERILDPTCAQFGAEPHEKIAAEDPRYQAAGPVDPNHL